METIPPDCTINWAEDFPKNTFNVVSPELPCGAAWLANCCLELNIPIWQPWGVKIAGEWQREKAYCYRYQAKHEPWQQTLPALRYGRYFQFSSQHSGSFQHWWPIDHENNTPTILMVRDPRDALFSHWRRSRYNEPSFDLSFEAFVHSRYHHYPFSFREYLLLFLQMWKNHSKQAKHLIIRFEDYKTDPQRCLEKVCHFLQLEKPQSQKDHAIKASSFNILKQHEDQLKSTGQLKRRFNYRSQKYEYKESFTPLMHDCMGTDFDDIYTWLGYESHHSARQFSQVFSVNEQRIEHIISAINQTRMHLKNPNQCNDDTLLSQLRACTHLIQSKN